MNTTESKAIAQEVIDRLYQCAASMVAEGHEHIPMLFVERDDGENAIIAMPDLTKDQIARLHFEMSARAGTRCATLVMEAWLYKAECKDGKRDKIADAVARGEIAVSEIPAREEVVLFNVIAGGVQWLCACKIDRAAKSLEKGDLFNANPDDGSGNHAEGRFVAGSAARKAN